ncbi:hypothetical protein BPT24_114 [Tenacibaculum phage pT24]|uniref:Holliday junction resolvase n=1 Tax=Tenacibaculum phage pT24 TaxID=1880590 RepID=A0A1B4XWR3_9CAUD|nr:RuvC-like Holliday junction resolvase [Tenacibaculum phage pT24]BAV39239.1 hypothetical protein BPT24_114 [Tenacibaculum phage pT24]
MGKKIMKVGLDMSIKSTGVCIDIDGYKKLFLFVDEELKGNKIIEGVEYIVYNRRLPKDFSHIDMDMVKLMSYESLADKILMKIIEFKDIYKISNDDVLLFFERPSLQSKGQASLEIPITNAIIRRKLLSIFNIGNFKGYPPSSLKKAFTGNGRASKDEMFEEYNKRPHLPKLIQKIKTAKIDDIVDAVALIEINS